MREIKFRAWDARRQKWYHKIIEWAFDKPKGSISQLPELPEGTIISQFTGLLDKQGKEIYEGDIVNCTISGEYPHEPRRPIQGVVNRNDAFLRVNNWGAWFCSDYEVIGNIYENPELIKEQQ